MKRKNKFIQGALTLSAGGLIAKVIGAFYRIPLTNIMGANGMGLYQAVFPMYALLLTISSSGLNIAVSRLVAEKNAKGEVSEARNVFFSSLLLLGGLGAAGSIILLLLGGVIARVQGVPLAAAGYRAIAPAVLLVCFISAFRGYFQGNQRMLPTAASQIIEQLVKMALSLIAAAYFMPDTVRAATAALWAVTFSEAAALLFLLITFAVSGKKDEQLIIDQKSRHTKQLILLALPFTLSGIMLPLTQLIDSALVLNILGSYTDRATTLFGLLAGPSNSLIALPVAVSLGFATAAVPMISSLRTQGNRELMKTKSCEAIKLTLLFAVPSAIIMLLFSKQFIGLLYGRLSAEEQQIASNILKIGSISIVFLSLLSTLTSILQATGRIYAPVKNLLIAATAKILLNLILLPRPNINIYGAAVSTAMCYMIAAVLDLFSLRKAIGINSCRA